MSTTPRTANVAAHIAHTAERAGVDLDLMTVTPDALSVYSADPRLTAALAVHLGLTKRQLSLDGVSETFSGEVMGIRVVTTGPVPVSERPVAVAS